MSYLTTNPSPSNLDQFKLDALGILEQFDQVRLKQLDYFIQERFKYPKGGGWDLDSLRENILWQHNYFGKMNKSTFLPEEITRTPGYHLTIPQAVNLIKTDLLKRYQPIIKTPTDDQIILQICQVIYAMEAVRIGLFDKQIPKATPPSDILNFL